MVCVSRQVTGEMNKLFKKELEQVWSQVTFQQFGLHTWTQTEKTVLALERLTHASLLVLKVYSLQPQ